MLAGKSSNVALTFPFERVAQAPPPLPLSSIMINTSQHLVFLVPRLVEKKTMKMMTIITWEWGWNEPGPLQPLRGVVEVGVRLLCVPGHVVFPTKPKTTIAYHKCSLQIERLPLCTMRTAELPVSRVDNAGELGIQLIILLNEVVLNFCQN